VERANIMQARRLFCTAARQVQWEAFEIPETPGAHDVIVKSACSLISAGTEIAVYSGSHIGFTLPDPPHWLKFPVSMGYALTGAVQATGSAVKEWAVGDRVLVHAPHGDWAVCDVRRTDIRRLPTGVSMAQGALARLGAISLVGVRQGRVALGETVAVLGLGLIGQFAAQLSHLAGARPVIGVDLIPKRVRTAAAHGIHALNPGEVDVAHVVREATDGRMAEVVVEATGNPDVLPLALELAAEGGRVVLLGSLRGKVEIDAYSFVHRKGISLIGAHDRLSAHPYTFHDPWTRERNLDLVLSLLADGSLKSDGLISHRIRPDDIQQTYERLIERPSDYLGVLVEWDKDRD
jgi:2-desacetyl-2-hydroxyethyl bacteriochlorophyllide A dehydrogenase